MSATLHHTPGREDWERTFRVGKGGAWVVLAPYTLRLPSSAFNKPVLIGSIASKVKNFEGMPLYAYTLEIWGKIFKVLEAEAQ